MADAIGILAAGGSSRFGAPKQLATWRGRPLVRFAAEEALAVCPRVFVVLGAHLARVAPALEGLPCVALEAADWELGPGASLRRLVDGLPDDTTRLLVTLVDLPRVDRSTFTRLFGAPGSLVAAGFGGTVGAPAVFSREHFGAMRSLPAHAGAKALLGGANTVRCPEAAFDVDTADALARLG